jgi:hypothetical protein
MKKIFKQIFFLYILFFFNSAFSAKLKIKYCEKKDQIYRCADICEQDPKLNLWVEFLVNKETKEVLAKYYMPKDQFNYSQIYRNCSIFSSRDWSCEASDSRSVLQMNDGVYSRFGADTSIAACAK